MVGLWRWVRFSMHLAALAVLAEQGCANPGKGPAADAAAPPSPEVESDQPVDPGDAPAMATDVAPNEDASLPATIDSAAERVADRGADRVVESVRDSSSDEPRDEQAWEALSLLPISSANVVFGDFFQDGRMDGWRTADPGSGGALDTDWSIVVGPSGPVYCQGTLDNTTWHISRAGIAPLGDQIVEAIIRIDDFYAATSSYMAAVFARYDAQSDSGYLLALRGDGRAILRKRTQGATASWTSGPDLGIVPGHWYTVRLEVVGPIVTAFVDGAFVMAVSDTMPLADGTVALGTYGATMEIQSVVVAKP
jgi:hypothetical protein